MLFMIFYAAQTLGKRQSKGNKFILKPLSLPSSSTSLFPPTARLSNSDSQVNLITARGEENLSSHVCGEAILIILIFLSAALLTRDDVGGGGWVEAFAANLHKVSWANGLIKVSTHPTSQPIFKLNTQINVLILIPACLVRECSSTGGVKFFSVPERVGCVCKHQIRP